jgi:hypothetical protein
MRREKITKARPSELRQSIEDLLKDGSLVAVTEVDPATGKLRNRYFHRVHAPKPQ